MIYLHFKWGGGYSKSEVDTLLNGKADTSHTHTTSDITDFPTIPSKTSELTNDSCIPLSGTTSITGSLIPSVANASLGSNSHGFSTIHVGIINLTSTTIKRNENSSGINICGGNEWHQGGTLTMYGKDSSINTGCFMLSTSDDTSTFTLNGSPSGTLTWDGDIFHSKSTAYLRKSTNNGTHVLCGGTGWFDGGCVQVNGKDKTTDSGCVGLHPSINEVSGNNQWMLFKPDGTWQWTGQAVQLTSDKRFKQQISNIDDKLLDAWEDVELSQFKYNDAVNEKGDNARLHTGYVVQQIDEACKSHNIDISEYGLYCHEEYPEETEEVTIENEDGTTKKETKVIEPAREYYSLRYTETLVVECAYIRRENDKLKQQFKQLEETVNELKSIINYSEIPNS